MIHCSFTPLAYFSYVFLVPQMLHKEKITTIKKTPSPHSPHQVPKTTVKKNCLYLPKLSIWIEVWVGNIYIKWHNSLQLTMVVTQLLLEQIKSFVFQNNIHSCLSSYLMVPLKPASSQVLHINEAGAKLNEGQYRLIFSLIHHPLKRLQIWRKSSCVVLLYFQTSSRLKAFSVRGLLMQKEAKQVGMTEQLSPLAQTESKQ